MSSTVILERPLETVRVLAPYATCIHLKDFVTRTRVSGFSIHVAPVGTGMLDVKAFFHAVRETGRDPDVLLEQFMGRGASVEETLEEEEKWIRTGIRNARCLIRG